MNNSAQGFTNWTSLHIYVGDDQDALLVNLFTFLQQSHISELVKRYWFIRHCNGGPHVRLRLECVGEESVVEAALQKWLKEWLGSRCCPTRSFKDDRAVQLKMMEVEQKFCKASGTAAEQVEPARAAGSLISRRYSFDSVRYGGPAAAGPVECHFCQSSMMALVVLPSVMDQSNTRLTVGLHLLAAAISKVKLERLEILTALDANSTWASILFPNSGGDLLYRNFVPIDSANPALPDFLEYLELGSRDNAAPGYGQLMRMWRAELGTKRAALQHLIDAGSITVNPDHVLLDFIHLVLNRLGLSLVEECYLYRLASYAIQQHSRS